MSQLVPCVLLLAVEVLLGCVEVQCWIQLGVSQLVPCVLLLVVEVLLGCVAAAVLDSASVSVGSLCIIAGSRGPAGMCCCSSAGFSLCLRWLPVHRGWQYRPAGLELLQQYWIRLLSQLSGPCVGCLEIVGDNKGLGMAC